MKYPSDCSKHSEDAELEEVEEEANPILASVSDIEDDLRIPDTPYCDEESDVASPLFAFTEISLLREQTKRSHEEEIREEIQESDPTISSLELSMLDRQITVAMQVPD